MMSLSTRTGTLGAMTVAARPYHHGNLAAALLAHAERALEERGAGALSLRELARHFADKQALLGALAESGFERLEATLADAVSEAAGRPFQERLTALARAYVGFAVERPALLELMYATKHDPAASDRLREAATRTFAIPLGVITEAQAAGDVVPGDPEAVGIAAWATIHGIASMSGSGMLAPAELDALVAIAIERAVLGLCPR
jgi:AcrR family transcriptional regulator